MYAAIKYFFDFIFFLVFYLNGWQRWVFWLICASIKFQQQNIKEIMYFYARQKFQSICLFSYSLINYIWFIILVIKFFCWLHWLNIFTVQVYLIINFISFWLVFFIVVFCLSINQCLPLDLKFFPYQYYIDCLLLYCRSIFIFFFQDQILLTDRFAKYLLEQGLTHHSMWYIIVRKFCKW